MAGIGDVWTCWLQSIDPPTLYRPETFLGTPRDASRAKGVAGMATRAGSARTAVRGVVVGMGVVLCYDILMSGWERKKARHHTGMYLDEKLSHRIFLLTTAPRRTLQAPLPGPFETKLSPADPAASAHDTRCYGTPGTPAAGLGLRGCRWRLHEACAMRCWRRCPQDLATQYPVPSVFRFREWKICRCFGGTVLYFYHISTEIYPFVQIVI